MTTAFILVAVIVVFALLFDFLNGFHDAANAIATVVVTRTLTPLQAVLMAGLANFVGYFFFSHEVAKTIGKGVLSLDAVTLPLILAALLGAIVWNIITWWLGLPTSSSHALIGGLVGAGLATGGHHVIIVGGVLKIVAFIFLAPLIGMLISMIFTLIILHVSRPLRPTTANSLYKKLQLVSSMAYSVSHGTNDAQKTMGIIAMALVAGGMSASFHLETWTVVSCYAAIGLGTMFGGWRIVRTMGTQITKIRPIEGFCAETASAMTLFGTAHFGIPVSTTHVISGSIMGVGAVEHAARVRWVTARKILWAWVLTIPASATVAAIAYGAIALAKTIIR